MKLKNSQIVHGVLALRAIPVLKKAARASYSMAKTLRALTDAVEPYEETRRSLRKQQFGDDAAPDERHPKWAEWEREIKKLDDIETDVPVHQCSREDLNPAENDINHTHLAQIWFLFTDW